MNSNHLILFIATVLLSLTFARRPAWASESPKPNSPRDAETVLEISVLDLVSKKKVKKHVPRAPSEPQLDKDYARKVASLLVQEKPSLLSCLEALGASAPEAAHEFLVALRIQGDGRADVQRLDTSADGEELPEFASAQECVMNRLRALSYPKHPLKGPVTVKFPIRLREESI